MNSLFEYVSTIPTPFNMVVLIVLFATLAGVITSIARQICQYMCHRDEIELKREMVDRGMTAQEIEQVIRVKSPGAALKDE